jgi:hypothetical protein
MASNGKTLNGVLAALFLILFTALMVPAAWILPPGWNFIALMVLMILFMITLGVRISGRPAGILINERNLMSLSRFQLILWTLIVLSAYLTIALERVHAKPSIADALGIALDPRLWSLMGISTASLVGTSLIQSTKKDKDPKSGEVNNAATALGEDRTTVAENRQGLLYKNADIKDAAFSDMFEGDEVGNTAYVDLAKVQMFFFTVVAALSYGVTLFYWIITKSPADLTAFPVLSGGLIAILGISHAGFLANNSTAHTPTA